MGRRLSPRRSDFDRVELVLTGAGVALGLLLVVEMLVVDGSDLGSLPPRRAMRVLAKRLAEKALDALLDASPVDVIRLAAVVGAVTAAEAEKGHTARARRRRSGKGLSRRRGARGRRADAGF